MVDEGDVPDVDALEAGKSPRRKASGPGEKLRAASERPATKGPPPTDPEPDPV